MDCHEIKLNDPQCGRLFQGARTTQEIIEFLPTPFVIINMATGEVPDVNLVQRHFGMVGNFDAAYFGCYDYGIADDEKSAMADDRFLEIVSLALFKLKQQANVHVHCAVGISRSSYLSTAILMAKYQWDYDTALAYLRKYREHATPNPGFERHLRSLTDRLHAIGK